MAVFGRSIDRLHKTYVFGAIPEHRTETAKVPPVIIGEGLLLSIQMFDTLSHKPLEPFFFSLADRAHPRRFVTSAQIPAYLTPPDRVFQLPDSFISGII